MTTSTFIFRVARVEGPRGTKVTSVDLTGSSAQQLVLGEYYNYKREERKAAARLHYGQHFFLKGMFYIYKFSDGQYTSSFNKDKMVESHIDISINFEESDIQQLLAQMKGMEDVLVKPPTEGEGNLSTLQDKYQLHVEVKEEAVAEVSEFFAQKKGEKDRLAIRLNRRDVVSYRIVGADEEEFKASVGGVHIKLDVLMEGLFGKPNSELASITTVEDVRNRFITQSSSKKRKARRKSNKDGSNVLPSTSNQVVEESTKPQKQVITCDDEEDGDIPI